MKKTYIKPIVEQTECVHAMALLEGSYDYHAESKGGGVWGGSGHQVIENGHYKNDNGNDNLWDD